MQLIVSFFPHYVSDDGSLWCSWGWCLDYPCFFAYRYTLDCFMTSIGNGTFIQGVGFTYPNSSDSAVFDCLVDSADGEVACTNFVRPIVTLDTNYLINL